MSWLSMLANYSLVLSLWWNFDHKQVKEVGLLDVRLVIRLVMEIPFQLGLLSTEMILVLEIDKTV